MSDITVAKNNIDMIQGYEAFKLPTLDSYTEQKVAHSINELFKGYTEPVAESMKSLDTVVNYVMSREQLHSDAIASVVTGSTKTRGVINACRWDLGHIIDVAMNNPEFGADVAKTLAEKLNVTEQEIHAFRQVHLNMTRVEAYVLGLYGASIRTTMLIASIQDEAQRKKVISECCNTSLSIMDAGAVARHRSRMEKILRVALLPTSADTLDNEAVDTESEEVEDDKPIITEQEERLVKTIKVVEKIISDVKPFRKARIDKDSDELTAFNPSDLDEGNEKVSTLYAQLADLLQTAARELNDVEDYVRALREAIDSTIIACSDETPTDYENTEEQ